MIGPLAGLTKTPGTLRALLQNSCIDGDLSDAAASLAAWEGSRRFLVEALRPSGKLLDYGCANGFLLHCLLEWSRLPLKPYGVDIDVDRVALAQQLFPGREHHFTHPEQLGRPGYPADFDQVYWAVGDNLDFQRADHQRWLRKVMGLTAPRGRFAIGFYDTPAANGAKIAQLTGVGIDFDEIRWNPDGNGEAVGWLDLPT
ncbi:class I SAM-dependent methyltransferase [Nocardioides sp. W7]|uniref:class I SAM-dependent methyltransferase n=1 Tax=Nocardioides sp. W7 TaxID=2931390 RepID=UPI001FD1C7B6|nr:class I SAM-dependent methyltransferase [Nocardioides sp. W7]